MPESRVNREVDGRLGALEEGYKSLGREIHGLRDDFQSFAGDVRKQIHQDTRTPWAAIIGAAAVVVSVIGGLVTLGANGPLRDLNRHDLQLERVRDKLDSVGKTRFTSIDGKRLDDALQREMRDLDKVSSTRIDALDAMLQREMRLLTQPIEARLTLLEKRVTEHQDDGHPHNVIERLKSIEGRLGRVQDEQAKRTARFYKIGPPEK